MRHGLRTGVLLGLLWGLCGGASAQAPVNTLVWTARDLDRTYGFIVYRGAAEKGPFRRLNPALIRADAGTREYRYADHDVQAGTTYYYWIDAVSENGVKKSLSTPRPKKTVASGDKAPG